MESEEPFAPLDTSEDPFSIMDRSFAGIMEQMQKFGLALSDSTRITILAMLIERPMYGQELAKKLNVKPPTISHHLGILKEAGLVQVRRENAFHYYSLNEEGIQSTIKMLTSNEKLGLPSKNDVHERIVATFFKDGKLVSIPAQRSKRRHILEELARQFEWGRVYEEHELNTILKQFHEDTASIRREMLAEKIMARETGHYWLLNPNPQPS